MSLTCQNSVLHSTIGDWTFIAECIWAGRQLCATRGPVTECLLILGFSLASRVKQVEDIYFSVQRPGAKMITWYHTILTLYYPGIGYQHVTYAFYDHSI